MKNRKYLAFDLGASSGRGIIGNFDGNMLTLEEIHRFDNIPVTVGGRMYWDIFSLFTNLKTGISKVSQVDSAGIDTWGVDYGLVDKNGHLAGIPVHYRDQRTETILPEAYKRVAPDDIYASTGLPDLKFNTLYQLLAARQDGEIPAGSKLLFMPDLLLWMLSGEMACEYTIASTSQMLNAQKRDWDLSMLKAMDIPTDILLPISGPGTVRGGLKADIQSETGGKNIRMVSVAGHDTASAVAAVPAQGKFAYISSGTWSLMGIETKEPVINPLARSSNLTNEGGVFGTYRVLKNIMGLWIEQECLRVLRKSDPSLSHAALMQQAGQAPGFRAFIDPDDDIFFTPGDMPERIRDYCRRTGQYVPETVSEIMRVVFESLAMKYRKTLDNLEKLQGKVDFLNIVGGGIQNTLLDSLAASACHKTVLCGPIEATAIGNLLMQAIALGDIGSLEQAREVVKNSFTLQEYEPQDADAWEDAYQRFLKVTQ